MKSVFKVLSLTLGCLLLSSVAFGQWTLFTVEEGAAPGGTTYPTLASALATAATYPNGPHKIKILAGDYYDVNLTVANVNEIYGDPAAAPGDIVFHGASNFLTMISGVTISNMTITGYGDALSGPGASGCTMQNIVFDGNNRAIVFWGGGSDNNVVDNCQFLGQTTLGVYFDGLGNSVTNCPFDANTGYGVYMGGGTGTVTGCTFANGGTFAAQLLGNGNFVRNCTFDTNAGYGVYFNGGNNSLDTCLFSGNTGYGVICAVGSGVPVNAIANNCFLGNNGGGVQGSDGTNLNWWSHNYWSDDAGVAYALDGGGGNFDNSPWRRENQVTGPASVEILDPVSVDLMWMAPGCAGTDTTQLAAYEFTVNYDPTKLDYVGAAYDEAYLGGVGDGALYTGVAVDEVAGTITFAATNFDKPGIGDGRLAFVNFQTLGTTPGTTISVSSNYRDENNNPIPAGSKSLVMAIVDTELPSGTVVFDDPVGNMTFSDSYNMVFSGAASDNFCLSQVWYQVPGFIGWTLIKSLSGTADTYGPVTVSMVGVPEGAQTIQVLFRDCSSNDYSVFVPFTVDKTGPTITGLTLTDSDGCANAGYTSNQLINVTWTDDGTAVQQEFYRTAPEGFLPYDNTTTYTLPLADGTYTLWVHLKDAYGNVGGWSAGIPIILDKVAPVPNNAWVVSNPTPAKTNLMVVPGDAFLDAVSGALYVKVSETLADLDCGDGGWATIATLPPAPRFSITLSPGADGPRTVYFASKDAAGNVGITSTTITLDTTPPALSAFAIHSLTGKPCAATLNPAFMAVFSYSAADVTELQYSYDNVTWALWDGSINPSPDSTIGGFVTPGDGWKKVYGRLKDNIGNVGASKVDSIYVDLTPPTLATAVPDDITPTAVPDPTVYPNTTNEAKFRIQMTGLAADVEQLAISQDAGATWAYFAVSTGGSATFDFDYTWTSPAECTWYNGGRVKTIDCAGNASAPVAFSPNGVFFDFTAPTVAVAGPAATNNPNVSLTITAADNCGLYLMRLAQGSLVGVPWIPFNANPIFALTGGDGTKVVNLEVADYGGNIASANVTIDLDATPPTAGTFVITSPNPLAVAGYTSVLAGNTYVFTPGDGDLTDIAIFTGTAWMGWYAPAPLPYTGTLAALAAGAPGIRTIDYYLRDDAGNQSGPFQASIDYSNVNPPAPVNAMGVPGASVALTWDVVPDAQAYQIRYNFTNQNPTYGSGLPPFPGSMIEGILEVQKNPTNAYTFEGPQDDLYAFGIWTLSKFGLWSLTPNQQVLANNYRLGDFEDPDENLGSDGCLSFDPEFVALAVAYNTSIPAPHYNPYLDFAPTSDASATGYAIPDGNVDFEDLVIFALNHRWSRAQSACDGKKAASGAAAAIADLTVSVEVPTYAKAGDEFTVPISLSDGAGVAGYHLVFDFDKSNLDVVSVNPGQVYEGVSKTFFYHDADAAGIDISSAVLDDQGLAGGEIATVTFRSKVSGPVTFKDHSLDVRDWDNHKAQVNFSLTASGGSLPTAYSLSQNYPNPFNPTTTIELALPVAGQYRLTIYNVIGQEVKVMEGYAEAGYVTLNWDASKQSSGVYLYKVTVGDFSATRKMMLLK